MKAVILAGGLGTRLSEETSLRPKPMVEVGGQPIIWHVMKILSAQGINEFIICLGYKGYVVKEYFLNYKLHLSDVSIHIRKGDIDFHATEAEDWTVRLIETGEKTMTGGRIKRIASYLDPEEPFLMTYGDGVADVDVGALTAFHREHGKLATVTGVTPPGRFGALEVRNDLVTRFREKPAGDGALINGGFFILSPKVISLIDDDDTVWEQGPLERLALSGQLSAYVHRGFWQPMDTLRDKVHLDSLWARGDAPWKVW
jgi:glucose-1-phosphate cytidylyltransferase